MIDHNKKNIVKENNQAQENDQKHEERREFLRKSLYAAYATPVIISLLVNKANAAESWNPGCGKRPGNQGQNPWGGAPPPWENHHG
ncbi:MAG TPA: hypothetical protein ENK33_01215 [Desulfobacterales bacterium]|nr:hypothetical protein [Desulfobacterales bacterium]